MGWAKLTNPKPPKQTDAPAGGIRISSRLCGRGENKTRWIRVQIGSDVARKGSFTRDKHKCHILLGSDEEKGNVALVLDDATGEFTATKQKGGAYQISITAGAAKGKFELDFTAFTRDSLKVIGIGSGPGYITVEQVPEEFLAR